MILTYRVEAEYHPSAIRTNLKQLLFINIHKNIKSANITNIAATKSLKVAEATGAEYRAKY